MATFEDLFSRQAEHYAKHRPTYPATIYEFVARNAPSHELAWDCATGSGQAANGLRSHFDRVIATDASASQLEHALAADGIEYRVALAEDSGLPGDCACAITVATAFHWFDHEAFADEVRRVARDGAVIVVWTYAKSDMPDKVREVMRERLWPTLEKYWSASVKKVWDGYEHLYFPFEELAVPSFEIVREWTIDDYLAYTNTWSATQSFVTQHGHSPFAEHEEALRDAWGSGTHQIRWPLDVRAGRVLR